MATTPFDPDARAVGRAVRGAMASAGLTQAEAAKKLGVGLATMSRRINGQMPFTFPELVQLSRLLGVSVADLATDAERIAEREKTPA